MIYTIKQNEFYSSPRWFSTAGRVLNFNASFDITCNYISDERDDTQKLFGMSNGFDHEQDSARIGWRAKDGRVDIYPYCKIGGQMYIGSKMGSVIFGQTNGYRIEITRDFYIFQLNGGERYKIQNLNNKLSWFRYQLYPYVEFGENNDRGAPQQMSFTIKKL